MRTMFFRINGQTRNIEVHDKSLNVTRKEHEKAEKDNPIHVGAPLQGMLSKLFVKSGDKVKKNQPIFVIEAMKMETTVSAREDGKVSRIVLDESTLVEADDLVMVVE